MCCEQQEFWFPPPLVPSGMQQAPASSATPAAHALPLQQPALQAVWLAPPHAVPHVCVCVSQACPAPVDVAAGQSVAAPQPHVPSLWQTLPFAEVLQSLHVVPVAPQAVCVFPATHAPMLEQQPALQPVVPEPHEAEHVCVALLQAWPDGQSVAALHPHAPEARHTCPAPLVEQSAHVVPLPPHCAVDVPGWQVPDVALEQQPVGHGWIALHVKLQIPPEHPWAPAAQSLTDAQPHWPPWLTGSQACPCVLAAQLAQAPPLLPHSPAAVPATHVPLAAQHPPLHVKPPAHEAEHAWVDGSHACPTGQSAAFEQPEPPSPSPPPPPPASVTPASPGPVSPPLASPPPSWWAPSCSSTSPSAWASTVTSSDASAATSCSPCASSPHDAAAAIGTANHARSARSRM
jgi:hypothetical protein